MSISDEIREYLTDKGASSVGFADITAIDISYMKSGISIVMKIPPDIIRSITAGPTMAYYDAYHNLNEKLNILAEEGASFIRSAGYEAIAQTTQHVKEYGEYRTALPHKTVATLSGLGWIGKSALFVTREYGSAIRLSSILTNLKLEYGTPVTESICGDCDICKNECPGQAIIGKLWSSDIDRNDFFNPHKCREKARSLAKEKLDKEITLCGKCIEVCPYTKAYIVKEENLRN